MKPVRKKGKPSGVDGPRGSRKGHLWRCVSSATKHATSAILVFLITSKKYSNRSYSFSWQWKLKYCWRAILQTSLLKTWYFAALIHPHGGWRSSRNPKSDVGSMLRGLITHLITYTCRAGNGKSQHRLNNHNQRATDKGKRRETSCMDLTEGFNDRERYSFPTACTTGCYEFHFYVALTKCDCMFSPVT